MILLDLLLGFLRVGLFSFGGAYSAIPLIRDVVLGYGWMDDATLSYMIAVSESTPGPIMVNLATYVGASQAGFWGAAVATTAVVCPAFVIVLLITAALGRLLQNRYVGAVLDGLKACVAGVILATGARMLLSSCTVAPAGVDGRALLITAVLAAAFWGPSLLRRKRLSRIALIGLAAALGIAVYGW